MKCIRVLLERTQGDVARWEFEHLIGKIRLIKEAKVPLPSKQIKFQDGFNTCGKLTVLESLFLAHWQINWFMEAVCIFKMNI